MSRILIIEDDLSILRGLKDALARQSFDVITAIDGACGYRLIREENPDLIILDLMLPKMDGLELCQKIRKEGMTIPLLMLTARGGESDRVEGLNTGADDYVTKPFSLPELLARVRALLRRITKITESPQPEILTLGRIVVDFKRFEARNGGERLEMSRKEYGILRYLAARGGEVATRDELLNAVWGLDRFPTTRTVDNHIVLLRSKIEDDPGKPKYLITVHGVGYKLQPEKLRIVEQE
jgi:DNA-binding response OmpR family regulator